MSIKDWTGNKKSTFVTLGASNHAEHEREKHDYYSTDPKALKLFLNALERDDVLLFDDIYEPACGEGHLSEVLIAEGYNVHSTDLINRGYGDSGVDFLTLTELPFDECDVLTNPPYKFAKEFVEHSLELLKDGFYCVMFLKIQFLEGKGRRKFFDKYPP